MYSNKQSEIVYDFEVQENIYSITALFRQEQKIMIYYHLDYETAQKIDQTELQQYVLQKAQQINGLSLKMYPKILGKNTTIGIKEMTLADLQAIFENPQHYVIGFNSNYYDLPIASFLLQSAENNANHELPDPASLRFLNNLLIKGQDTIVSSGLLPVCNALNIKPAQRSSFYSIAKLYDSINNLIAHQYNESYKTRLQIRLNKLVASQQAGVLGVCPNLYQKYLELNNSGKHVGMQLDMKLLNEKDKDESSKYTSLKRIAAQLGYQIEEPDEVDLSADLPLNYHQIINLLAYNASDVIVTTLIFEHPAYQNVLANREGLLKRFNHDKFFDRLNVNSTSAKSVEKVISPIKKLHDQADINTFYPIHDHRYDKLQAEINQDYDHHLIADFMPNEYRLFNDFNLEQNIPYTLENIKQNANNSAFDQQKLRNSCYQKIIANQAWLDQVLHDFYFKKLYQKQIVLDYIPDRDQRHKIQEHEYQLFKAKYLDYMNPQVQDLAKLDAEWTKRLQTMPAFAPKHNKYDQPNSKPHQRFRVRYGELQEDLLEHIINTFPKFPKEVYLMYNEFRGTKSTFDESGQLIKTARENAVQNFVKKYSLGVDEKGKAIPPENVYYKFRKKTTIVTGISVNVQVPDRPMCLVFSIGGVHGEVIKQDMYEQNSTAVKVYNAMLAKLKQKYPDPADFLNTIYQPKHYEAVTINGHLINIDCHKMQQNKALWQLFITKERKGRYKYKAPIDVSKNLNPKKYVIPIDMTNPVHVDVDSLYPSLMINLHLFSTWTTKYNPDTDEEFAKTHCRRHWNDLYAQLRAERVKLKKTALSVPKEKWTEVQRHQWAIQLIDKLLLNSASGIADGKWDTNVRLNNKATSMRIMGQLALTYLVYSVEPKGVYSTSTNTDGVYLTSKQKGFNEKEIEPEIEHWKYYFHLGATPEIMARFISKDANNRFEQGDLKEFGAPAGGTIGNAITNKDDPGGNPKKKMTQPFVIDNGIVHYFKAHQNICTTYDLNHDNILQYLRENQQAILNAKDYNEDIRKIMLSFCWPMQPHKHQMLVVKTKLGYEKLQHVNRFIIVKKGFGKKLRGFEFKNMTNSKGKIISYDHDFTKWAVDHHLLDLHSTKVGKAVKISNFNPDWEVIRVNLDLSAYFIDSALRQIWQSLDLNAYADLTEQKILGTNTKPIWVEPKFQDWPITKKAETIKQIIVD